MAIALDATSSFTDGGTTQDPYVSGSFTPPVDSWVFVCASAFAASGDDSSFINVFGTFYTWTRVPGAFLDQLNFGGSVAPPPIAFWMTKATAGIAITVTQDCVDGVGFSHVQGIWVLTGTHATTPVIDADTFTGLGAASITMTATDSGQWALFGMCDWGNSADVPAEADAAMTTRYANANADIQSSFRGDLVSTGAGGITVGTQVLATPQGTNAVAILVQAAAEEAVTGVLDIVLPVPTVDFTAEATASGVIDISLPVIQAAFDGELTATGTLDINLPVIDADFDGELTATAQLAIDLPVPVVALDGEVSASGQLDLVLPVPNVNLVGELPVSGVLDITLPVPEVSLTGTSAAGGATMGPCGWTIPDPLCSDTWAAVPANVKSAARDYAALVLWGATGREFGLCEITVRPCGYRKCGSDLWNWWGFSWQSGTWMPYIWQGQWFNGCACPGTCCCDPECAIRLSGDVEEILEVLIDGVPVDPDTYFVYDKTWLVRTDTTLCWPQCPDLNVPNGDPAAFQVTYLRGNPVPAALLNAASVLADEFAKACTGGECRLSNRVTSLARNGIQVDMLSPEELMENGMTGLWEVDSVIRAINPYGRVRRGKIYSPGRKDPRMQTWP